MAGLEVNAERTKYIFTYRQLSAGKIYNITIVNKPVKNVTHFVYSGTTPINQNCMH